MKTTYLNSIVISVFILLACTVLYSGQEYVISTAAK
jgi:hypothetical protein